MTPITIPPLSNRLIVSAIGYGALILAWLTPEENTIWVACLLGTGLAYLGLLISVRRRWGGRTFPPKQWIPVFLLMGALVGLGAALCTFLLMIFKNAQHSHTVLDFPNEVTLGVLARIPVWMGAGVLVHLAMVFGRFSIARN